MSDAAGRAARDAYGGASRAVRLHVAIRWWTCPFAPIVDALAGAATVLDVGCGHGLLPLYLASRDPGPTVTGVDVDHEKLLAARAAAVRAGLDGRVRFDDVATDWLPGDVPPPSPAGGWDAITVVDVLYLLGATRVERLLGAAAGALAPGGRLVVKELDTTPAWKHRVSQSQELVSTRILRITEGDHNEQVSSVALGAMLTGLGLEVTTVRLDRRKVHPDYLVVATRPSGPVQ